MKDAGEYIGIGIMVLLMCYGCAHCQREQVELDIMQHQAEKADKAP